MDWGCDVICGFRAWVRLSVHESLPLSLPVLVEPVYVHCAVKITLPDTQVLVILRQLVGIACIAGGFSCFIE